MNTVKYITAMVVVTNIGWSSTTSGSIRSTSAKATAPRRPERIIGYKRGYLQGYSKHEWVDYNVITQMLTLFYQ